MIENFVKELLQEKGLPSNLDPKVYDQLVKDMSERATDLINRRLLDAMTDDQLQQFDTLMAEHPEDVTAAQAFVQNQLPDQQIITNGALAEFRQLYLGNQ